MCDIVTCRCLDLNMPLGRDLVLHVGLDGDGDMRVGGGNLLFGAGGVHLVSVLVGDTTAGLVGRSTVASTARGDPVDRAGVQGHVQRAREKTEDRVLITSVVDEREDIAGTEDKGNHGTDEGTTGDLTELTLAGALEDGGGAHERADEKDGQPAGDEDVIENKDDRGEGLETNEALVVLVQDGDVVQDHEDQDDGVRRQQQDVEAVKLK